MARKDSKLIDFFRKVGDAVLGIGKLPSKFKPITPKVRKKALPKPKPGIPHALQGFFERRNAGWPEYVMLKVQIAVVALVLISVFYVVFPSLPTLAFLPLILLLSGYALFLIPTQLRHAFKRDYPAYRSFVIMYVGIVWALLLILRYYPLEILPGSPYAAVLPVILVVGLVLAAFAGFRLKYGRDYTYGVVQRVKGNRAVIRIGYDLRSNVKHGLYTVESLVKVKKDDVVKVGVDRPTFGLRGARVKSILEKAK